jgi:hypothetical protein
VADWLGCTTGLVGGEDNGSSKVHLEEREKSSDGKRLCYQIENN